jgi:hypothetical protein
MNGAHRQAHSPILVDGAKLDARHDRRVTDDGSLLDEVDILAR